VFEICWCLFYRSEKIKPLQNENNRLKTPPENINGLIRQYFPKGSFFGSITEADVEKVMERLNHRPRKTLNYKTPFEVFFENSYRKAS
jgi:IS30 family transposase